MTRHIFTVLITCAVTLLWCANASASPGSTLMKFLAKHLSEEGGEEAAEKITKEVGEVVVERVATKVAKEGGEETLEGVSVLVVKHGPDVVRALDNSPAVKPILSALGDLPAEQVPKAAARLAAGPQGKELAETTMRYGSTALRAEVSHPGVGGHFVKALGTDGAALCQKITTDQAVALGRHVDDIAALPPSQRSELLKLMSSQTDRFVKFVGRFIEQNPGKVLLTTSGTAVVLANSERLLGGDELKQDPDGNWIVVSKPGIAGKGIDAVREEVLRPSGQAAAGGVSWLSRGVAAVIVLALAAFAVIKLWGVWRHERQKFISIKS